MIHQYFSPFLPPPPSHPRLLTLLYFISQHLSIPETVLYIVNLFVVCLPHSKVGCMRRGVLPSILCPESYLSCKRYSINIYYQMNQFLSCFCLLSETTSGSKQVGNNWLRGNLRDFPGGAVVKNLPANAGDMGSSPGLGRSQMPRSN